MPAELICVERGVNLALDEQAEGFTVLLPTNKSVGKGFSLAADAARNRTFLGLHSRLAGGDSGRSA